LNGLVRGVWLEAGTHRVAMRYVPPGLVAGALVSFAALAAVAGLAWLARRSARRPFAVLVAHGFVRAER